MAYQHVCGLHNSSSKSEALDYAYRYSDGEYKEAVNIIKN